MTDECKVERDELVQELNARLDIQQEVVNNHASTLESNTVKLECLVESFDKLEKSMKPVLTGVHSIQESVKVLTWIVTGVKWVATISVSVTGTVYVWSEHAHHFFTKGH